jgi:hypothetical protein
MFKGTDLALNIESDISKHFITNPSKLRILIPMQNFYCDHRNFDSANQPLVAPIPLARLTHAIDRIVAIYRQNDSRFKIATLMKKLILRIARISGKCLNVLRRIPGILYF